MARSAKIGFNRNIAVKLLLAVMTLTLMLAPLGSASADQILGDRSVELASNLAGAATNYNISLTLTDSTSQLGSIEFLFCSNSALIVDPCTAPTGFDASAAVLASQSGESGFTISSLSNANSLIINHAPGTPTNKSLAYLFDNVKNPSSNGSTFLRIFTFTANDAGGTMTNHGGLALAITSAAEIQAQVPPYITFCTGVTIAGYDCNQASGDYVDFGELSLGHAATGEEQLLVATNAKSGYDISVVGQTMTSGNNIIEPLNNNSPSISGTSQFGLNLVANSSPGIGQNPVGPGIGTVANNYDQPNSFRFNSGESLASSPTSSDYRKYTVSYIVNRPSNQAPGVYATTMTFIALGNF